MITLIVCIGLAILVGAFAALSGTGGGSLNVPIFEIILLMSIDVAIGTSLFVVFLNSISTNIAYAKQKRVDFKAGGILLVFSAPMSILGSIMTSILASISGGQQILKLVFYMFILCVGFYIVFKKQKTQVPVDIENACKETGFLNRCIIDCDGNRFEYGFNWIRVVPVAMAAGFVAGFLGIGGGVIQVPMLHLICGIPIHVTVATSGFMILFNSLTGSITHIINGNVDVVIGLIFAGGTIIGAQIGAKIAKGTKNEKLKAIISICLIGLSVYKIISSLFF